MSDTNPKNDDAIEARHRDILGLPQRIKPLEKESIADLAKEKMSDMHRAVTGEEYPPEAIPLERVPEIFFTMLHNPPLWDVTSAVSMYLNNGKLSARDREMVVLRTGWLWQAPYEWGEHVSRYAGNVGITREEIDQIVVGSAAPEWSEYDRALMLAVEELLDNAMISDSTWLILEKYLDSGQLIELIVLVGQFTTIAFYQNSLRLAMDPAIKGLHERDFGPLLRGSEGSQE